MEGIRQGDIPGVQLRRRVEVPGASPAGLWAFWSEAERLSCWLADRARTEDGPPPVWWLESDEPDGGVCREYAEVLEQLEPQRLVLGFRQLDAGWEAATKVTIECTRIETGCEVMVFQEGFQDLPLSSGLTVWERSRARWTRALAQLAELATEPEDR